MLRPCNTLHSPKTTFTRLFLGHRTDQRWLCAGRRQQGEQMKYREVLWARQRHNAVEVMSRNFKAFASTWREDHHISCLQGEALAIAEAIASACRLKRYLKINLAITGTPCCPASNISASRLHSLLANLSLSVLATAEFFARTRFTDNQIIYLPG